MNFKSFTRTDYHMFAGVTDTSGVTPKIAYYTHVTQDSPYTSHIEERVSVLVIDDTGLQIHEFVEDECIGFWTVETGPGLDVNSILQMMTDAQTWAEAIQLAIINGGEYTTI